MNFRMHSLKLTAKAPENEWLEDEMSFWDGLFSRAMLVLGSVNNTYDVCLASAFPLSISLKKCSPGFSAGCFF